MFIKYICNIRPLDPPYSGIIAFSDIKKVILQTSGVGDRYALSYYRLALITKDRTIFLTKSYSAGTKDEYLAVSKKILRILSKDSIMEQAKAGYKIQAIKFARDHYKMGLTQAKEFVENLAGAKGRFK